MSDQEQSNPAEEPVTAQEEQGTAPSAQEGYKLMSYNTSWVLDCHENQIDTNNSLSESAAIIAKMTYIKHYDKNDEFFKDKQKYKDKLNPFRMSLADKATEYVKTKVVENYDFIALIEQAMHVPNNDHANYDDIMTNKFDLDAVTKNNNENGYKKESNIDYGFLLRMKKLGIDITNKNDKRVYNVAYDNGLNAAFNAGEGIAILYKKSLVDRELTWNQKGHPGWNFIKKNAGYDENKNKKLYPYITHDQISLIDAKIANSIVNFYSDDLGPKICYDDPNADNPTLVYTKSNDKSDEGRPIIMTGGVTDNDKTLNLFVAAHGANIMNLYKDKKPIKDLPDKDPLFLKLSNAITSFIQNGLDAIKSQLESVTKVNIFLGGDFNDANGYILRGLLENGITLTCGTLRNKKVEFHYPELKANTDPNTNYESILSCCANSDSSKATTTDTGSTLGPIIRPKKLSDTEKDEIHTKIQDFNTQISQLNSDVNDENKTKIEKLNADIKTQKNNLTAHEDFLRRIRNYGDEFYDPDNFKYNGDYALFGTTDESSYVEYSLNLDKNEAQKYTETGRTVYASDHLPVISMVINKKTGGKRFRKRQTTYRKKHRSASTRSRRSSTRRSSFHSIRLGKGKTKKSLCLDVEGGSHGKGARFIAWPCHGGPNQKFRVIKTRKGRKCLQAKHSRHCLDEKTFQQVKCPK